MSSPTNPINTTSTVMIEARLEADNVLSFTVQRDEIEIDPLTLSLNAGDRVVIRFRGLPAQYRPFVAFPVFKPDSADPRNVPHEFGPFRSLSRSGDEISGIVEAGATGTHEAWYWLMPEGEGNYLRLKCRYGGSLTDGGPLVRPKP